MGFPVKNFKLWKCIEDPDDEGLLDLNYFCHCVGCGLGMIEIGNQRFKAKGLTSKHRLLIDGALIGKLDGASSLFDEIEVLSYFIVINYTLVGIKGELLT